jgi:hypothetical protein
MGFLRKVGRKIKKGVKKLFSSKIGALVGSIAIGMILGPAIGEAWKGIKGALGIGQGAVTSTTAGTVAGTGAGTGAGAGAGAGTGAGAGAGAGASSINMSSTLSTTSSIPSGQINMEAIEKSITSGPFNVSNTVTGSINNVASSFNLPGFNTKAFETTLANVQPSIDLAFDTSTLTTPVTTTPKTNLSSLGPKKKLPDGFKVDDGVKQPFFGEGGKLREYGQNVKKDFQKGFSVGDIASGVVTGYATTSLLSGDQTDEGGYGRVATGNPDVQAQASYIQDISSSYNAAMGTTGLPNFSTIAQQTLYGNGSPQSFYQPLNLPNIG